MLWRELGPGAAGIFCIELGRGLGLFGLMRLPAKLLEPLASSRALLRGRWLERSGQLVAGAAVFVSLVWFVALFLAHAKIITQPGPQEFNEPAIWHATWLLNQGRNPYSQSEMPGSTLCFSPFYNYVVLAFQPLLGIDYIAHRMVNLVFLMGALALMVRAVLKAGAGWGIGLPMAVFFYWMSLYNIQITARPDTLGLFLFLLAILVPWERSYSRGAMAFGLGCAVLAFHCKSYFAVGGCATLLAAFFLRSKMSAIRWGVGFFGVLGASFLAMCIAFPYYYIVTVVVQRGATELNSSDEISEMHTAMLADRAWPFLVMIFFGLGAWFWRRWRLRRIAPGAADGRRLTAEDARILLLGVALWIFTALVYFYMGRNAGAYFTYHLHLIMPLLFVLAAYAATRPWARMGFGALLAVFVCWRMDVPPVPDSAVPYRKMEQMIGSAKGDVLVIASSTDIMERNQRRVLHNGNTMFLGSAFADGGIERDPMIAWLAKSLEQTEVEVRRKIAAKEYEFVYSEFDLPYFCDTETLKQTYVQTEQIDYYTYFGHSPVRVWRPKR